MIPAPFIVIVDANVLFPFTLRDTVLRAADVGFYQLRWTAELLDEMERNLVSTNMMTAAKAQVTVTQNLRDSSLNFVGRASRC